ncbi:hypothetical protein EVAR_29135_1 [Eumeta japonica]|uniref:Uncharacterized protein n=1 Tax=Eumeta variegata TaxID=151549 RepID=A0A4C1VA98_EUMVA|nr:hypothetical protein EVAR_29135_1 [Eumeta japonica]
MTQLIMFPLTYDVYASSELQEKRKKLSATPDVCRRGHYEHCEENFSWLRGEDPSVQKEQHALIQAEMDRRTIKISEEDPKSFRQRRVFGRYVFPTYAIKIVTAFAGGQSPLHYVVGLDLVICAKSVLACVVVNMFKHCTLLFNAGMPEYSASQQQIQHRHDYVRNCFQDSMEQ